MDLQKAARLGADGAAARGRPRDAEALGKAAGYVRGLVAGISLGADALRAPIAIDGDEKRLPEVVAAFTPSGPGPDYAKVIPDDGMLLVSLAFNPTKILPWLRTVMLKYERSVMDRSIGHASTGSGIELEKEVLPALSGHVGFAFHTLDLKTSLAKLMKNIGAAKDIVTDKPGTIHTSTWIGVKDAATLTRVVEQSVAQATQTGTPFVVEPVGGKPAWRIRQDETEFAAFAVEKETLVFTTGTGRLDKALSGLAGEAGQTMGDRVTAAPARRALASDNTLAIYLSVPTLFRNFPILNLFPAVARPAKRLGDVAFFAKVTGVGIDGELLVTLPPRPAKPGEAGKDKTP